jgi:hypothetical protein
VNSDKSTFDAWRDDLAVPDARRIPLRNRAGEVVTYACVDAVDAELADYRWHRAANGYVARRERGRRRGLGIVLMHRQVLGLKKGDGFQVDHIDGDKLNNRRSNLRIVTNAQNGQNIQRAGGSSRYRGVSWHQLRGAWRARVMVNGKERHLGLFETEEEAARVAAAARVHAFSHANEERNARVAA